MNNKAQFTQGPTCTCEIVMRTGETMDSSLGDRPCSDISRIVLCPFHVAAPAMYEALHSALNNVDRLGDVRSAYRATWIKQVTKLLAQAEGR